ncbi:MAG: acyl-CoA dehydrogenase [Dehalococcoidia bacterium]|jgi:acyl-CoA dehydrogenase
MILLNPKKLSPRYPDERSLQVMARTVDFFEKKGKKRLLEDAHQRVWYGDFLEFVKDEKIFATLLTPPAYGGTDSRWDTFRNVAFNEILAFYGLPYWYTWQVTTLGLGPIWMSGNEEAKRRAAELLKDGAVFAFGLSERQHGADIYSTEMTLTPQADGSYRANGEKYYIGNGNVAPMISTFGKMVDSGEYVFFAADSTNPHFELLGNVVDSQQYVSAFALRNYPVSEADILSKGREAWDASLNTVNICKFNLGAASIGICTHAFYEAITHAANRRLYGMCVTDFPHVKQMFTDAYARLVAMKLFTLRAADYVRVSSPNDRRYLLYNSVVKMKVTTQGVDVIELLWDVIAAKGFEKDMYFERAAMEIHGLPRLEGTVHVNIALILKFMANYFFNPAEYANIGQRSEPKHDDYLFRQGPTKGMGDIQFHDYNVAYSDWDLPNVNLFREQTAVFSEMLAAVPPDESQSRDTDFLLTVGEIFTLVAYGQLILENARIDDVPADIVDQMFDCFVRDFSKFALQLYSKPRCNPEQAGYCLNMIRKPAVDEERYERVWRDHVYALKGSYEMNP